MHSIIFQITKKQVNKNELLSANTILQGEGTPYDYCSEINDDERKKNIFNLITNVLPKGMFEFISQDVIEYKGGADQWKKECVKNIQDTAKKLNADNITDWTGPIYKLDKMVNNPLNTDYQFYFDEKGIQNYAEKSYELLRFVSTLETGSILYIGGVIDYHH